MGRGRRGRDRGNSECRITEGGLPIAERGNSNTRRLKSPRRVKFVAAVGLFKGLISFVDLMSVGPKAGEARGWTYRRNLRRPINPTPSSASKLADAGSGTTDWIKMSSSNRVDCP